MGLINSAQIPFCKMIIEVNCYKSLPTLVWICPLLELLPKLIWEGFHLLFNSLELHNLKTFRVLMAMTEISVQRVPYIWFGQIHVGDERKMGKTSLTGLYYWRWGMKQNIYEKQYMTNTMYTKQFAKQHLK